jgi:hypothetical protein
VVHELEKIDGLAGTHGRQPLRQVRIVIVFLVIPLAGGLVYYLLAIWPMAQFFEEKKVIEQLLHQWWEGRPPLGIDEHRWQETWGLAYNGYGNVCFTSNHVSLQEMKRLKADIQEKMQQPATMARLRWFWDRLGETGPHGKQYIKQMTPLMDEAIREPAGN